MSDFYQSFALTISKEVFDLLDAAVEEVLGKHLDALTVDDPREALDVILGFAWRTSGFYENVDINGKSAVTKEMDGDFAVKGIISSLLKDIRSEVNFIPVDVEIYVLNEHPVLLEGQSDQKEVALAFRVEPPNLPL